MDDGRIGRFALFVRFGRGVLREARLRRHGARGPVDGGHGAGDQRDVYLRDCHDYRHHQWNHHRWHWHQFFVVVYFCIEQHKHHQHHARTYHHLHFDHHVHARTYHDDRNDHFHVDCHHHHQEKLLVPRRTRKSRIQLHLRRKLLQVDDLPRQQGILPVRHRNRLLPRQELSRLDSSHHHHDNHHDEHHHDHPTELLVRVRPHARCIRLHLRIGLRGRSSLDALQRFQSGQQSVRVGEGVLREDAVSELRADHNHHYH
mmetsp:Transcript_22256/g.44212  ORF Transcript_22256/g.44212 Transcript_22256/m.44212 type:complete len:258 (-) Transcript_22256:1503-2276(-)